MIELIENDDDLNQLKYFIIELINFIQKESKHSYNTVTTISTVSNAELEIQGKRTAEMLNFSITNIDLAFCLQFINSNDNQKYAELGTTSEDQQHLMELIKKHKMSSKSALTISQDAQIFLSNFKNLSKITSNIFMNASRSMATEKIVHKIWIINTTNELKINEHHLKITDEEKRNNEIQRDKFKIIRVYKCEMENIKMINLNYINGKVMDSMKTMNKIYHISDTKQNSLQKNLHLTKEYYEQILNKNLKHLKKKKEQKFNLKQKLQSCFHKYDTEVGGRCHELDLLYKKLKENQRKFEEWKIEYNRQQLEYNEIITETEAEESRIREQKLLLFVMNRAAKTIQLAWRSSLNRLSSKKKGKGRKGK